MSTTSKSVLPLTVMSNDPAVVIEAGKVATAPFDKRFNADVIFLTSDNVYFYLHKTILSMASTFFETMFSLVQTPASSLPDRGTPPLPPEDLNLPVVEVSEDSLTLDHLLRYCYPARDPVTTDLALLDRVLGAATKYALEAVPAFELASLNLRRFVEDQPLQAFVVAYRHSCEDEALLAAKALKRTRQTWFHIAETFEETCSALCYTPEMSSLPAGVYSRLIRFVSDDNFSDKFCDNRSTPKKNTTDGEIDATRYPFSQQDADVVFRSADGIDFRVHRMMVNMQISATPTFPLQAIFLSPPLPNVNVEGLPVIQVQEPSYVLQQLLKLCYPAQAGESISDWSVKMCREPSTIETIAAAIRYGFTPIDNHYQSQLRVAARRGILAAYGINIIFGWFSDAEARASDISAFSNAILPTSYDAILEMITAAEYYRLLEYWNSTKQAILDSIETLLAAESLARYPNVRWKPQRYLPVSPISKQFSITEWAFDQALQLSVPKSQLPIVAHWVDKERQLNGAAREGQKKVTEFRFLIRNHKSRSLLARPHRFAFGFVDISLPSCLWHGAEDSCLTLTGTRDGQGQ